MLRRKGLGEAELPVEPRISPNPRPGSVCRLSSTKLLFSELASAAGTLGPGAQATSRGHITLTEVTGARAWADTGRVAVLGLAEANKDCCVSRVDRVDTKPQTHDARQSDWRKQWKYR